MTIEEEVFKKYQIDLLKLENYGFEFKDNTYVFKKDIGSDFEAIIKINLNGVVSGQVIDLNYNLEYSNIRLINPGSYALKIKEEYESILKDIALKCGIPKLFIFEQTNRIAKYIKDKYDILPEYLFASTPDCGVYRNKKSKKWFGIIMQIDKSKLDSASGLVEVMNVKVDDLAGDAVKKKGIYKAYHMSKKYWISMVLDNTLSDEEIIKYIDISYNLVKGE
ncbi:MAG: MmcQ/YjbR family DNA-binding protein [Bacilli bacterium]|nr:MmcQ/YjbR family DNA-binding protein [Bacilli bacterium]